MSHRSPFFISRAGLCSVMPADVYSDTRAREMARIVLAKTLQVRPGEAVTIETWDSTVRWSVAFVLEARRMGAHPVLLYNDEETYWKTLELAGPKVLGVAGRHEWAALEKTQAYVFFWGPSDGVREEALPSETAEQMTAWDTRWFETAGRAGVRLARMFLGRVSEATARAYGVDAAEWSRELVEATLVDPARMHRTGLRLVERLKKGTSVEIRHPNGTALKLQLRHRDPRLDSGVLPFRAPRGARRPRGSGGILDVTLPAGVVTVAVDEEVGEGRFVSNCPTDSLQGPLVGGRWDLRDAHLTSYSYDSGGATFERQYRQAGPHLATPALLAIGLNPKIRQAPVMRDQQLGAITFALGGNRYFGGQTDGHGFRPYLHLTEAELRIDGKVVVQPAT